MRLPGFNPDSSFQFPFSDSGLDLLRLLLNFRFPASLSGDYLAPGQFLVLDSGFRFRFEPPPLASPFPASGFRPDSRAVAWICFRQGVRKRMQTYAFAGL